VFLKNQAAMLELALINWAVQELVKKNFIPVMTPDLAHVNLVEACGFSPRDESS